jgi:MYXO-CTERM domain-containing protein
MRMARSHSARHPLGRSLAGAAIITAAFALAPSAASAHFILDSPPSWQTQDALGAPEKLGPCGDEAGGTPTGTVTAYGTGQTITVTVDEKIFHPGHYRIALAVDNRSELPPEPIVTAGATPCGTVPVESPPVFPVLADGVFTHTAAFTAPQTIQLTLPANVTCTKCTLQVIEFMSDHPLNNPGGCFYHHCADISISNGGPSSSASTGAATTSSTSTSGTGSGGAPAGGTSSAGCKCSVTDQGPSASFGLGSLLCLAVVVRRRRRSDAR